MNEVEFVRACQSLHGRDQAQRQKVEDQDPFPSLCGVKGFSIFGTGKKNVLSLTASVNIQD
jgi:hypothetical protein